MGPIGKNSGGPCLRAPWRGSQVNFPGEGGRVDPPRIPNAPVTMKKYILQFDLSFVVFWFLELCKKNILYKRISKHIDVKNERNKMCYDRTRWLRSNSMRNLIPPFVPHILILPINLQYGLHVQNLFYLVFASKAWGEGVRDWLLLQARRALTRNHQRGPERQGLPRRSCKL